MATVDRWLLPDGIEEVLPPEAASIELARRRVLDLFQCWGYELVITPHIEYIESLLSGAGQDLDLRTFKVTDPQSGRLIGFRADITPQVARIDAHTLRREGPSRLCYAGSVLHARPRALSTSRSPIQLGAELYGDASPASDVEVISLLLEVLTLAEVPDVHLDLGHVVELPVELEVLTGAEPADDLQVDDGHGCCLLGVLFAWVIRPRVSMRRPSRPA